MLDWSLCIFAGVLMIYFLRIWSVRVRAGPAPLGSLFFAYAYYRLGESPERRTVKDLSSVYPGRKIKLCYRGAESSCTEFGEGVLLNEEAGEIGAEHVMEIFKLGASLFKAPAINHAVYAEFPLVPFFPIIKWMAVLFGYPKLNSFIQKHNLCAYPFIEIHSGFRLLLVVPLVRQDDYVVKEAEPLIFGKPAVIPARRLKLTKDHRSIKRTNKG